MSDYALLGAVALRGHAYVDGAFGLSPQILLNYAVSLGATRILFINDMPSKYEWFARLLRASAAVAPGRLKKILGHYPLTIIKPTAPGSVQMVYVQPEKLPSTRTTRSSRLLTKTFDIGVADALALTKELRNLFTTV